MFTQEQIKKGLSERIDRYFAGYPDQDLNQNVIKKTKEVNYKNKTEEQRRSELYGLYLASCSISDYDRMDPDDAILGWKDLPQGWDKDFNDTYSPKNMTFSD